MQERPTGVWKLKQGLTRLQRGETEWGPGVLLCLNTACQVWTDLHALQCQRGRKREKNAWNMIIVLALFKSSFQGQALTVFLLSFSSFPQYKAGILLAPNVWFLYVYARLCLCFVFFFLFINKWCSMNFVILYTKRCIEKWRLFFFFK